MPRKTQKEALRQDPSAPWLFDEEQLPTRPEVLTAVREQRYRHTGARFLADEQLALRLVELLTVGWGVKRIARELEVSPETVRAAREELVRQCKLGPYKERVAAIMQEVVELGTDKYLEALQNGDVPAAQIPVGVGIFADKRALLLGEPTVVAGGLGVGGKALSLEKLNAWVDTLGSQSSGTVA